jgi:tol-pal system protein YbgF
LRERTAGATPAALIEPQRSKQMEFPVKSLITPIAIALAAIGCSTAFAAEDPMKLKMVDLEARLIRIERVIENQSLIQLAAEVDMLRSESMQLRGEIETLRYETENSNKRQRDLYVDVDRRLQAIEQGQQRGFTPTPAPPPAAAPQATPPPPERAAQPPAGEAPRVAAAPARPAGTDQQNYQAAFELMQGRKYEEAGRAFGQFLVAFPQSPLADNAQYWLAETQYVRGQYQPALAEFQKVLDHYPQSAKLPDALLKVGYCQAELGNREAARTALQQVMRSFPDTTAARLASQRLERLSQ